ncbi:hypothetical protein DR950_29215 [Kitasatospora xanthocidica]|uniref:Uncharacterized protein n=1 Tax=Kitasatospora xanthocidica TaxID=83382 RepID=A0A373A107_9ACTN|nr:hypothetical protein [Kitasatospora xanthocidica]RGD61300.1 hypothetical protein DR950_29215 [Kitasatospora xanthocidica]
MHFHGYAWAGDGRLLAKESERRPVEGGGFRTSGLPPMMTGWWLLRPAAQIRGTWTTPTDAADWLAERYAEHTPDGDPWLPLPTRHRYAIAQLADASDVVWSRWLSGSRWSGHYAITCPNRTWPTIPCPAGLAAPPPAPTVTRLAARR